MTNWDLRYGTYNADCNTCVALDHETDQATTRWYHHFKIGESDRDNKELLSNITAAREYADHVRGLYDHHKRYIHGQNE